jgi:hypothetical protein
MIYDLKRSVGAYLDTPQFFVNGDLPQPPEGQLD